MDFIENNPGGKRYGKTLVGSHFINNRFEGGSTKEVFKSLNPSDLNDVVGVFPVGGEKEIQKAVDAARSAFAKWSQTPAPVRGEIIGRFGKLLAENKQTLSWLVTREIGKTKREALGSVQEAIDTAHFFQSEGRRLYGQTVWSEMRNKECMTYRRPYGVVGIISAGNFPIAVPSWKIIPALLCGNTVVWKPSEDSPVISYVFAQLALEAGLPPGVLNVVHGLGGKSTGEEMIKGIDKGWFQKFSFTGSTVVGKMIGEACGRQLQVPSLELGGKNPLVIMDDADLGKAVEASLFSCYGTGGQRCTSTGNLILHEKIADRFIADFSSAAEKLKIGNPCLDETVYYGALINSRFGERFLDHFEMAKKDGAKLLFGKGRITKDTRPSNFSGDESHGFYVHPTLWDGVKINMNIAQNEVFGPTVNVIRVKSFEEALSVANGTAYGLSSAIFTQNPQSMYLFKNHIDAGMTSINNSTTGAEAHLPFGGTKGSGNGTRESGIWVIDAYTKWQAVNVDLSGRLQLAQIDAETATMADIKPMGNLNQLFPSTWA
ncbi:MAG: aldehyde dehydrogenase family protein [Oligoflexia bacterium]|nr:aldehyde dehydrogenase family protein [Oligoflexia bacterium]